MTDNEDRDIISVTLSHKKDRGPLQYISGEQKLRWEAIERVARRLVYNKHLCVDGPLRTLINHLEVTLIVPQDGKDHEASSK